VRPRSNDADGLAFASFIVGAGVLVLMATGPWSSIVGLVLGIVSQRYGHVGWKSTWGIVLNAIGVVLGFIFLGLGVLIELYARAQPELFR
jgi:hypothetical protein